MNSRTLSATPQKRESHSILPAPLSPEWAFVVQLRQGTPLTPDGLQGRIEHLVSGQATTFASLDELRAFMERVLGQQEEKPP